MKIFDSKIIELKKIYSTMYKIRTFDKLSTELSLEGKIFGPVHSYRGQEGVAAGVCHSLEQGDIITSTHRGHGHYLAKGGDTFKILSELLGKSTGSNKGWGGSMHVADLGLGIFGANGIVGAGVPIASGAALSFKNSNSKNIAVAFFGDGAMNQGVVMEAFNIAAIWKLPQIFICENNKYSATVPSIKTTSGSITTRALGFGLRAEDVDGQDVMAVLRLASEMREFTLQTGVPCFINANTYRYDGHFATEIRRPFKYRTGEEQDAWEKRDPLKVFLEKNPLMLSHVRKIEIEVEKELQEAFELVKHAPLPNEEIICS